VAGPWHAGDARHCDNRRLADCWCDPDGCDAYPASRNGPFLDRSVVRHADSECNIRCSSGHSWNASWAGLPGAAIVLTAAALFSVSLLFAPQKGLASRLFTEYRLRRRIAEEHLLRALFELSESELPRIPIVEMAILRDYRHWWSLDGLLQRAREADLVDWSDGRVQLMRHADIAADHVDRDADDVEHMLPESLVAKLELELAAEGRLPNVVAEVPDSPHQIVTDSMGSASL
jgi:manganese/zinc/iron transport system permease protein